MNRLLSPPNEKQALFLKARQRFIAYGGARGGGKSWAVRMKAMLLGARYPGIRMLLLRRSFPELRENHILPLISLLQGTAIYKETEKAFAFHNGSRLRFGYCDGEADVLQYQGQEFDVIFIDEATQFSEYQFRVLSACLRGVNSFPKRMYLTCNPGGVGHEWVKRLFITRDYRPGERAEDYLFIPARVYDNAALMAQDGEYLRMLQALPEDLRRAWLEGDWDVFAGQYFTEFSIETHVREDFIPPKSWRHYLSLDYGLDMLAALWIAVDEKGKGVVYRELYESDLIISQAAAKIEALCSGESLPVCLAPPDLWNRRQETGKSAADIFYQNGLPLQKTSNDRVAGWLSVKEWLTPGEDGPRLTICQSCKNLIRCLPLLQHDGKNPNDCANSPHELTHAPDALRGFCVYWASAAEAPEERTAKWLPDMLEDYEHADAKGREYLLKKWGKPF